jgi:hypothetical protein
MVKGESERMKMPHEDFHAHVLVVDRCCVELTLIALRLAFISRNVQYVPSTLRSYVVGVGRNRNPIPDLHNRIQSLIKQLKRSNNIGTVRQLADRENKVTV